MDRAPLIGIGLGFAVIIGANVLEGGSPTSLLIVPPMLLVFGGTVGAAVAGGTMADAKCAGASLKRALGWRPVSPADPAGRAGLPTRAAAARDAGDDFLSNGVALVVDGTDPEELREILEAELHAKAAADRQAAKFFHDMGGYAPTIGIIGTVMGLVHVLENLSEPDKLGHLIAGAFVATLWGVLSANLLWLPIGNRLNRLSALEIARMELVVEGVLAVQAGANPRLVAQRLRSLLPAADREPEQEAA